MLHHCFLDFDYWSFQIFINTMLASIFTNTIRVMLLEFTIMYIVQCTYILEVSSNRLSSIQHSITFTGPKIWKSLPVIIRDSESLNIFKRELKSYFISQYWIEKLNCVISVILPTCGAMEAVGLKLLVNKHKFLLVVVYLENNFPIPKLPFLVLPLPNSFRCHWRD